MRCPKCKGAMYAVTVEGHELQRCGTCEGLWFAMLEQEHLKAVKGSAAEVDCAPAEKGKMYDAIRNYPCPSCGGPMVKMSIAEQPHIHVEQCSICAGVFFDAGEFTDYQDFTLGERIRLFFSTFRKSKAD